MSLINCFSKVDFSWLPNKTWTIKKQKLEIYYKSLKNNFFSALLICKHYTYEKQCCFCIENVQGIKQLNWIIESQNTLVNSQIYKAVGRYYEIV